MQLSSPAPLARSRHPPYNASPMGGNQREWADGTTVRLERQDPYLRLQSVTIFVRDLDRSLEFYVQQLGFQLVFDGRLQP
ncbi:MAG TPA: VOC family protein, partial [Candidatus Acidoferrales bacterium]|nr:VOC family protein [Candidatus Acidoferrales bacterium]